MNLTSAGDPHDLRQLYRRRAHILATNTFNANRISQADYGAEDLVHEINVSAARIIREAIDARDDGVPRFVAGAVGPTNKTLSLSPDVEDPGYREVTFDEIADVYVEQCRRARGRRFHPDRDRFRHSTRPRSWR